MAHNTALWGKEDRSEHSSAMTNGASPFSALFFTLFTTLAVTAAFVVYHRYQKRETLRMIYDLRRIGSW